MSGEVRAAAIDPAGSFLVQAPAGSGKTELLTRRILRLLAVVDEPEEILALTFTRKAAAEMRARVIEALTMAKPADGASHKLETWQLAQAANWRSTERGWHLAGHPSRLRMMTLDSFTHALARQLPLLSGLGDMPVPSAYVEPLYREAAEQAVSILARRDPDQAAAVLLHQDHNMVALVELVADMLGKRDQWLHEVEMHVDDTSTLRVLLERSLAEIMQQRLIRCDRLVPIDVRCEMPALLQYAGTNLGDAVLAEMATWPEADVRYMTAWQRMADLLLTKNKAGFRKRVDVNCGFPPDPEMAGPKRQFMEMVAHLAEVDGLADALDGLRRLPATPCFDEGQWQVLEAQLSLLLLANRQLQQLFEQHGEADFIEIAMRAMRALEDEEGNPTDLLLKLDYRIHHILVDEFQDTSLLQLRLLRNLTEGWQAGDGAHRTLFMVGDPMQSIYRFRKAEVGLFLLTAENRSGLPHVEQKRLTRNFRSSPVIVDWVNRAFSSIFPDEPDILLAAVGHAGAHAALSHAGEVRLQLQPQPDADSEAHAVVALIRRELAKGDQRIAVLSRSRKHLHAIMQTLTDSEVPFRAVDILPLHARPEIRLLKALLQALLHPADRASWAALLRAPCCGIDTAAIYRLLAGDDRPVAEIIADAVCLRRLDEEVQWRVRFLTRALSPCLQLAGRMPLRSLLVLAWERLGMPGLMAADGGRNIEAMLDLVEEVEDGGLVDFGLLDERLQKLYAAPDASSEAARVELLTMHGAKGLQWDVVILPGLGYGNSRSDLPLLAFTDVPVESGIQPLIAVRGAVRSSDAVYDLVRRVEKTREENEQARLLYVACTRAETALHMFGHLPEGSERPASGSLLALLLPEGGKNHCFGAEIDWLKWGEEGVTHVRPRLTRVKSVPEIIDSATPPRGESEYFWAGPEAAPVGNAVHAALQRIGEKGVEAWRDEDTDTTVTMMRRMLMADGLSGDMLEAAASRSYDAVRRTLASSKGRWILSSRDRQARCEWALSTIVDGRPMHVVLDRSFIEADGTRWIVDYKTASHEGGALDDFLDQERQRHADQLLRYAAIVSRMEARSIRLGLYFPMLDGWREVPVDQDAGNGAS
ncbi:MAG TPA: UvrD-helicase domain-containing protein [Mariprofundaceae bacterium]|nr:UvrD-helicase domain-containing protein [Mariprofundaceae bacterium]